MKNTKKLNAHLNRIPLLAFLSSMIAGMLLLPSSNLNSIQHAATTTNIYPANIDYEGLGSYTQAALTNPTIGAVDINMNWAQVEPQQGTFNWTPVDKEAADWTAAGKKFNLIIRYINEGGAINCTGPQLLPSWEVPRIKSFCDTDRGSLIPDYFDSTFKSDLKAYAQTVAQHFAKSPYKNNLLYVRIGVGEGGEGFPLMPKGDFATVDKPQLIAYGYTPTTWAAWQKEMMNAYKQSFSYATVIYPLNSLDTDPATGQPVQIENAQWAATQAMGVGQQGLSPTTGTSAIFQLLRSQYPKIYIQYQTVWSVGSTTGIQADIQNADKNGAQFIEWYTSDIMTPANQSLFAQWQQIVNNKFATNTTPPTPTQPAPTQSRPTATTSPQATTLMFTVLLDGVGNAGDNANPKGRGNFSPHFQQRTLSIDIYNGNNVLTASPQTSITFNQSTGNFSGAAKINTLQNGPYTIKIKADGYLRKQVGGIQTIKQGITNQMPETRLTVGDINTDNQLNILDYNILLGCYSDLTPATNCNAQNKIMADLSDDTKVNQIDYNLFIRELSNPIGQ